MTRESLLALLKNIITVVAGYFLGKAFLGQVITGEVTDAIIGAVGAILTFYWSVRDKAVTIEVIQGVIRRTIGLIGGFLIANKVTDAGTIETITAVLIALAPFIQGWLSRKKAAMLNARHIQPNQLKGANDNPNLH